MPQIARHQWGATRCVEHDEGRDHGRRDHVEHECRRVAAEPDALKHGVGLVEAKAHAGSEGIEPRPHLRGERDVVDIVYLSRNLVVADEDLQFVLRCEVECDQRGGRDDCEPDCHEDAALRRVSARLARRGLAPGRSGEVNTLVCLGALMAEDSAQPFATEHRRDRQLCRRRTVVHRATTAAGALCAVWSVRAVGRGVRAADDIRTEGGARLPADCDTYAPANALNVLTTEAAGSAIVRWAALLSTRLSRCCAADWSGLRAAALT
eukprot:2398924-Prymnesium_polylepis.1